MLALHFSKSLSKRCFNTELRGNQPDRSENELLKANIEEMKSKIQTAFAEIQKGLSKKYSSLLYLLAGPTNLDEINIPSSGFFLLINGMVNKITLAILNINLYPLIKNKPDKSATEENLEKSFLAIAINWLGICAATDPNVVGEEIATYLKEQCITIINNTWRSIAKTLNKEYQTNEITINRTPNQGFELIVKTSTDPKTTTSNAPNNSESDFAIRIVLLPPDLGKTGLLKKLWEKLARLKSRLFKPKPVKDN